jgi:hypothetical protein
LAFLAAIPGLAGAITPAASAALEAAARLFSAAQAMAADQGLSQTVVSALAGFMASLTGAVIFIAGWLTSNTVTVLCLLAPGLAAPVLKSFRLLAVGSLVGLQAAHPALGLLASLAVIVICLILFAWSFRLTVWGVLFSFDLVSLRWRRAEPPAPPEKVLAFAGASAPKDLGINKRTLGWIVRGGDRPIFTYRRFLVFRRAVPLPSPFVIGRTLTAPILAAAGRDGRYRELMFFRLKDKGHEPFLREILGAASIELFGLAKSSRRAWDWLKGLFSRRTNELDPA